MNKKNLISIFIIIICILFISNGVFAETPQNFIKINSVNVTFPDSSNTRTCAVTINYSGEVKYASNIINSWLVVSGTFYHHPHFLIAPKAIDSATKQAYLEKLADFSKRFWRNNSASYTYTVNNKSVKIYKPNVTMAGLGVNSSYTTNITPCLDYSEIEVIAFVPPHANLTNYGAKWDNVMTTNGNDFDLQRQRVEIVNNINRNPRYYVNLDNKTASVNAPTGGSQSNTSTVNCSTNCSGYTKSTTYPTSSVTVGGQSLSRGQVCYKCNDSGTMADRCNPFNGQKSGFTLNLASYPDLKTEICPNVGATNTSGSSGTPAQNTDAGRGSGGTQTPAECPAEYSMTFELYPNQKFKCVVEGTIPRYQSCSVTNGVVTISNVLSFENNSDQFRLSICSSIVQENQPTSNTVASNTPQNTLEILNNSNLSDINFSLNNTNWYIVNKIDNPESYILGNKTQDKNLSINLDSFNEGPIYAIISTANKKTEIETELKQIYQTGAFTNYVRQTGTNQFKIDATFTGFSKLEYSLDNNSKNLKINIKRENTLENIVLIFMQKSTDKVNLVYTNLYSLDNKSQSLFNYCMVNRNIVNFYCKGHNCSSNASCLSSGRWDFDPKIFEGLTPRAVEPTAPVVPIAPVITQQPTPPVENVTLQKGADGCYTSNPTTLAKIRQENGIGITKQQFSGKRTMSSIVLPTTNTGTDDDPSLTIAQIRTAFNRSGTNIPQKVKDASPAFYNLGLLYDIDPVFILAFFKAERSMFNQNSPSITQTMINNNDISGVSYCRCGGVDTGNYCSYPTLEQGIEATYLNLTRGTTYSPNLYRNKSFSAVSKSWNGKDSYVTSMTGYLADTYTWAGK